MRRWFLIASVTAIAWFVWSNWFASESRGSRGPEGGVSKPEDRSASGPRRLAGPAVGRALRRAEPPGTPSNGAVGEASPEDLLLVGLEKREPEAVARALGRLREDPQARHPRVSAALEGVLDHTDEVGPARMLEMLGGRNAFLFSEIGRRIGERALAAAAAQRPWRAVRFLTRLAEACMNGPISAEDHAAREFVGRLRSRLEAVLRRTVLDPADHTRARTYRVRPGDVLDRIARRFRREGLAVEAGTIAFFNRIDDPRRLRPNTTLKIPIDPMRVVIRKDSFLMAVYAGDLIVRLYWVGHGQEDSTPEATFRIGAKRKHPPWYAKGRVVPYGHPDNPLGDYFVKFDHPSYTGFGAHGTSEPESIGRRSSRGCIRLADADIEEFFRVVPRGAEVVIRGGR